MDEDMDVDEKSRTAHPQTEELGEKACMLGYKDTHKLVSAVNAENNSGIFPLRRLVLRYLQSKQARLVVDEKGRTAATKGFTIDVAVGNRTQKGLSTGRPHRTSADRGGRYMCI